MARTFYHDFLAYAMEEGFSYRAALDLYHELEAPEKEEVDDTPYDEFWFDDEVDYDAEYDVDDVSDYWLDEGEELEIVAYYTED